jgi:hypothetical protein
MAACSGRDSLGTSAADATPAATRRQSARRSSGHERNGPVVCQLCLLVSVPRHWPAGARPLCAGRRRARRATLPVATSSLGRFAQVGGGGTPTIRARRRGLCGRPEAGPIGVAARRSRAEPAAGRCLVVAPTRSHAPPPPPIGHCVWRCAGSRAAASRAERTSAARVIPYQDQSAAVATRAPVAPDCAPTAADGRLFGRNKRSLGSSAANNYTGPIARAIHRAQSWRPSERRRARPCCVARRTRGSSRRRALDLIR